MKNRLALFAALTIPSGPADISINNFNLVESIRTQRSLELIAKQAHIYREEERSLLEEIQGKIWSAQSAIYSLKANSAIVDTKSQNFITNGETQIGTPDQYLFETVNVSYLTQERILQSTEKVTLSPQKDLSIGQSKFYLEGIGLKLSLEEDLFEIMSSVTAKELNTKNGMTIHSNSFRYNTLGSSIDFIGKANVNHPNYTMDGHALKIDFFESNSNGSQQLKQLFMTREKSKQLRTKIDSTLFRSDGFKIMFKTDGSIEESRAIGAAEAVLEDGIVLKAETLTSRIDEGVSKIFLDEKVEIQTPKRSAFCESAVFTPETGEFTLFNVASLSEANQTISGEKIIFSTKDSYIQVEKAKGKLQKESLSP